MNVCFSTYTVLLYLKSRFAAPQPLDPGEVINTTNVTFQRMCYQLGDAFGLLPNIVEADEDCLYLHVYVPGVWPPPSPLPVMIWFTGGAFVMGGVSSVIMIHLLN